MKIRLVVAKYNEDISWTQNAKNFDIDVIVYDKSNQNLKNVYDYIKVSDNYFNISNIGREAHTYIKHIIENYHNLYDIEIFSQGSVYDHVPDFWNKVEKLISNKIDFFDFSPARKISCLNEESYINISSKFPHININDRGSGSYIFCASEGHKKLYSMIHDDIGQSENAYMEFGLHAIFAVSSERIKKIPLETYKEMLNLFHVEDGSKSVSNHIYWAYEFEYAWRYIFSNKL